MSLFRSALILSLGIALLPSDRDEQQRLYQRTTSAVHWAATFCDRNASTCETASTLKDAFVKKLEFAATLAYETATRPDAEAQPSAPRALLASQESSPRHVADTLTPGDRRLVWRGQGRIGF